MGRISNFYVMPHPPIVIPEVGRGEEKKIKQTYDAYNKLAEYIANTKPDTIIIITPHGPLFSDAVAISAGERIYGDLSRFNAPNVQLDLPVDISLVNKITEYSQKDNIPIVRITEDTAKKHSIKYELDHGSLVPLYFIDKKLSNYKIVHITYGDLPKNQLYEFGMIIRKAVESTSINAVFIASGDLSHKLTEDGPYGYNPYGEKFDKEIIELLEQGDVSGVFNMDLTTIEEAGECGLRSYYIMLGAMDGYKIKGNLLSYEGTFGVGYALMDFTLEKKENPYVRLARESLSHYLTNGDYMDPPSYIPDEMKKLKRGVFVTLRKEGDLRGCVGTFVPNEENIAKEIIANAVGAGIHDSRFPHVQKEELDDLVFSVDVLTKGVQASLEELDPKKHGIMVKSGYKSGILLPDIEGIDTADEQVKIALEKAKISLNEEYTIEKFEVIRHK